MTRTTIWNKLMHDLVAGDRFALAQAITLVESTRPDHKKAAESLLFSIAAFKKQSAQIKTSVHGFPKAFRIGMTGKIFFYRGFWNVSHQQGSPHWFDCYLLTRIVAVLAIDPSSARTGGSILGDKTRMQDLSVHDRAYVRPSPSRGALGGIAKNTSEAIALCEAAGYDIIIVETVGVGQSETMVADLTDMMVLLVAPASGDELQGLKKGIVECADLVIVNKADGILGNPAKLTEMEYRSALGFVIPSFEHWKPLVTCVSSSEQTGFDNVWEILNNYYTTLESFNHLDTKRGNQRKKAMWQKISHELMYRLRKDSSVIDKIDSLESSVSRGLISPSKAADDILELFICNQKAI